MRFEGNNQKIRALEGQTGPMVDEFLQELSLPPVEKDWIQKSLITNSSEVNLAMDGDQVVGLVRTYSHLRPEPKLTWERLHLRITHFFIKADCRRRGWGSQFYRYLEQHTFASGYKILETTFPTGLRFTPFFLGFQFRPTSQTRIFRFQDHPDFNPSTDEDVAWFTMKDMDDLDCMAVNLQLELHPENPKGEYYWGYSPPGKPLIPGLPFYLVAKDQGTTVGFVQLRTQTLTGPLGAAVENLEIVKVFVWPENRRRGWGLRLVTQALAVAQNMKISQVYSSYPLPVAGYADEFFAKAGFAPGNTTFEKDL